MWYRALEYTRRAYCRLIFLGDTMINARNQSQSFNSRYRRVTANLFFFVQYIYGVLDNRCHSKPSSWLYRTTQVSRKIRSHCICMLLRTPSATVTVINRKKNNMEVMGASGCDTPRWLRGPWCLAPRFWCLGPSRVGTVTVFIRRFLTVYVSRSALTVSGGSSCGRIVVLFLHFVGRSSVPQGVTSGWTQVEVELSIVWRSSGFVWFSPFFWIIFRVHVFIFF